MVEIKMFFCFFILSLMSCKYSDSKHVATQPETKELVNLQHFNHLYKEIMIGEEAMGIVHIYSEYPDYSYAIEPKEGFTCVDDVARAILLLQEYFNTGKDTEATLHKIKMLTRFVLHLQNENGYFNNFLWNDLTINTSYATSVAELNWWSLRALWALETAHPLLSTDPDFSDKIKMATSKLVSNIKRDIGNQKLTVDSVNTLQIPDWLPHKYAADQTAVLILGLLPYYQRTDDAEVKNLINDLAKGIQQMQKGGKDQYPYGAFLSWENLWHAWGNNQAYALLKAGQQLKNDSYIQSALTEVDYFYPYLLKNGFAEAFWIEKKADRFVETKRNDFPQIAYGIRPMVWAATEAFQVTHDSVYLDLAMSLKSWLLGNNSAKMQMYDAATGRCFDGIVSSGEINKNAGAESTIECLLTLLKTNYLKPLTIPKNG